MSIRPTMKKAVGMPRYHMISRGRPPGMKLSKPKLNVQADSITAKEKEDKDLRAQLHKEIELRSRVCEHKEYECTMPVVYGKEYCARHILEDPTAQYKQCAHVAGNNERCKMPAPAVQPHDNRRDQGLCFEHARAALHSRQRRAAPAPPVTTTESLLLQLQHYVRPERTRTTSCASSVSVVSDPTEQDQPVASHVVDPFKEIDAIAVNSGVSASMMECASASDSDADSIRLGNGGNCRRGYEEDESEADDTEYDRQPLIQAGVFTPEEVVSEAKAAMIMLKAAYVRQMGRLKQMLHDARSDYIKSLKAETEQYCSISVQARNTSLNVRERRLMRKLKAYASYHRKHGIDALLARKLHRKRAKINEPQSVKLSSMLRCTLTEGGVRCDSQVVPATKYCQKHILNDAHQVLFVPCADDRGCASCREPVAKLPVPSLACRYHTNPPAYTVFTLKKEDSDSDSASHTLSDSSHLEDGTREELVHGVDSLDIVNHVG